MITARQYNDGTATNPTVIRRALQSGNPNVTSPYMYIPGVHG